MTGTTTLRDSEILTSVFSAQLQRCKFIVFWWYWTLEFFQSRRNYHRIGASFHQLSKHIWCGIVSRYTVSWVSTLHLEQGFRIIQIRVFNAWRMLSKKWLSKWREQGIWTVNSQLTSDMNETKKFVHRLKRFFEEGTNSHLFGILKYSLHGLMLLYNRDTFKFLSSTVTFLCSVPVCAR